MLKPPTGEPCAGEPHARFGGRGGQNPSRPLSVIKRAGSLWERPVTCGSGFQPRLIIPKLQTFPLIEVMMGGGLIVAGKPLPQKATPTEGHSRRRPLPQKATSAEGHSRRRPLPQGATSAGGGAIFFPCVPIGCGSGL